MVVKENISRCGMVDQLADLKKPGPKNYKKSNLRD
jgi:hypothetical protein